MPLVLADRVRDTTTTTGTGTVTLSGTAPTGYQNFSVIGNGNTTYYTINAGSQWEVGIGTYSDVGPTLARTTVLESSNGGSLVNFSAGVKDVFVTYPADEVVIQDGATIAAGTAVLGVANGGTGLSSTPANGAIDIGNGTGFTRTTLTAGTNISITNGAGSITINATDQFVGTVTSVAASGGTTGMTFSGSPITTSGTLTLGGTLNVANGGTGTATAFTAGSVVFAGASGVYSQDNANLFWDDANNRLGIGTSAPGQTLQVVNAGNYQFRLGAGSTFNYDLGRSTSDGLLYFYGNQSSFTGYVFGGVDGERMRITPAGLVGIGTSSPSFLLHGVQNGNAEFRVSATNVGTNSAGVTVENQGNRNWNLWANRSTDNFIIGANSRANDFVVINGSSGNVGIGNSSPLFRLDTLFNSSANVGMKIQNQSTNQFAGSGLAMCGPSAGAGAAIYYYNSNAGGTVGAVSLNRTDNAGNYQATLFNYDYSGQAWQFMTNNTERMRIGSSGSVGIGTSSPAAPLQVVGAGRFGAGPGDATNATLAMYNDGTGVSIEAFQGNNAGVKRNLWLNAYGGNVGIGTSAPGQRLEVSGSIAVTGGGNIFSNSTASTWGIAGGNAFNNGGGITVGGSTSSVIAGGIYFSTGTGATNTERMRIDSSGNVGIGTSSPGALLDVSGTIRVGAGSTDPGTGGVMYLVGSGAFQTVIGGAAFAVHTGANNARVERARITSDGSMQLSVGGVSNTHQFLYNESGAEIQLSDATGNGPILIDNSGGLARFYKVGTGGMAVGTTGTGAFQFLTNNTERMRIDSAGSVGIGTSSPRGRLTVGAGAAGGNPTHSGDIVIRSGMANLTSQGGLEFQSTTFSNGYGFRLSTPDFGGGNTPLVFESRSDSVAWTERMRLDASGNLSLGTTVGAARLRVSAGGRVDAPVLGNVTNYPAFLSNNDSAYGLGIGTNGVDGRVWLQAQRSDSAVAYNITLNEAGGNVGIGLTSPSERLHVSGNILATGNVTAYSDARLKKDVETISGALDLVSKMRGVRYTRIDTENRNVGVIAQEMLEVVPEVVQQGTGDDDTLSVAYGNLVGVLIEAIKELEARVAELEGK